MGRADALVTHDGFFVTHFSTVKGQAGSKEFYAGNLGDKFVCAEDPCYIKLANL